MRSSMEESQARSLAYPRQTGGTGMRARRGREKDFDPGKKGKNRGRKCSQDAALLVPSW